MVRKIFRRIASDESGAVTVDWVVLSAAVLALAFLVFTIVTRQSVNVGAVLIVETLDDASQVTWESGS